MAKTNKKCFLGDFPITLQLIKEMQHLIYLAYFIKAQKVIIVGIIDFHNRIGFEIIFIEVSYTS